MSQAKRNKEIVLKQHVEVWSASDPEAVDRFYAPDATCHLAGRDLVGREELKVLITRRHAAFAEWREDVELVLAEGDLVASRVVSTGVQTGPFLGVPTTGRRICITELFIFKLRDGLIVESWAELDMLGLLAQLRAGASGGADTAA